MNKIILILSLVCYATFAFSQGKVIEGLSVESKILGKKAAYSIYLPPDYETSERSYPVVYLLHGYSDNETAWVQFGQVDRLAGKAIEDGTIPPMIIAMPDAELSYYINDYSGKVRYEDFFIKEFMPHIENQYRIRADKRYRGLSGLSMGGFGSLFYAMKYPDLFAAAAPLSAAIYTESETIGHDQNRWDAVEGERFGRGLAGKDRITEHYKSYDVFRLAQQLGTEELKKVRYYFDCGDEDFLFRGNAAIHVLFREMGVPHEFRMRDGNHNWTYWREGIIPALQFIGKSFTQY